MYDGIAPKNKYTENVFSFCILAKFSLPGLSHICVDDKTDHPTASEGDSNKKLPQVQKKGRKSEMSFL